MNNLLIIESTDIELIKARLNDAGVERGHFTNGTYSYAADLIVPTTLSGFTYLDEKVAGEEDVFIIAVNSDLSMQGILDDKNASAEERAALEGQTVRAEKVAKPLAEQFPNRQVVVMFYDESTPTALYDGLAQDNPAGMVSLHKWGYGTDPKAPKIEGAHNFSMVFGFPLPNDTKPVCHDITAHEDQSSFVKVVRLAEETSNAGIGYFPPPKNDM